MDRKANYTAFSPHGETIHSSVPVHPGEVLEEEVDARDIDKEKFAQNLNISSDHLGKIFSGEQNISAEQASRIEQVLSIKADFWLRMRGRHAITVKEIKAEKAAAV